MLNNATPKKIAHHNAAHHNAATADKVEPNAVRCHALLRMPMLITGTRLDLVA
jgi:hypothetical protein